MKKKKYLLPLLSTILSVGFLFGCGDMGTDDTGDNNGDQDLQEETTNHDQQENQDTNE